MSGTNRIFSREDTRDGLFDLDRLVSSWDTPQLQSKILETPDIIIKKMVV